MDCVGGMGRHARLPEGPWAHVGGTLELVGPDRHVFASVIQVDADVDGVAVVTHRAVEQQIYAQRHDRTVRTRAAQILTFSP